MRLNLTIEDRQPKTIREIEDHLVQLRAAATILSGQQADHDLDALHGRISDLERQAADSTTIASPADAVAALDVLAGMLGNDSWHYADRRDERLFEAIREGLRNLNRCERKPDPIRSPEKRDGLNKVALRDKLDAAINAVGLVSLALTGRHPLSMGPDEEAANSGAIKLLDDTIELLRGVRDALE